MVRAPNRSRKQDGYLSPTWSFASSIRNVTWIASMLTATVKALGSIFLSYFPSQDFCLGLPIITEFQRRQYKCNGVAFRQTVMVVEFANAQAAI